MEELCRQQGRGQCGADRMSLIFSPPISFTRCIFFSIARIYSLPLHESEDLLSECVFEGSIRRKHRLVSNQNIVQDNYDSAQNRFELCILDVTVN